MKIIRPKSTPSELEHAIESKRALLAYLRSKPKHLTIESYVCLTGLLRKAGWHLKDDHWRKGHLCLATLAASETELNRQIAIEKDRLLRQTVKSYRGEPG
jgi:hypothetical protein